MTANVALAGEVEAPVLPSAPTLRGSLRAAAVDFYYNSWRLVPANILWALGLGILYVVFLFWPFGALLLLPLLALPTVGLYRMAALIVRGESVSFWDGIGAWRRFLAPALAAGIAMVLAGTIFTVNLFGGLVSAIRSAGRSRRSPAGVCWSRGMLARHVLAAAGRPAARGLGRAPRPPAGRLPRHCASVAHRGTGRGDRHPARREHGRICGARDDLGGAGCALRQPFRAPVGGPPRGQAGRARHHLLGPARRGPIMPR